jgi:hypothetical protein
MPAAANFPLAVRRYLEELELELKQQPGVSPEEALSDAREFLISRMHGRARSGEGPPEQELYDHFVATLGAPSSIAQHYAAHAHPFQRRPGLAPGWRICCTRCGRSAPLAAVGGIRLGAKSFHKYTLGWCRDCRRFRFLRIIQDLDSANLTERLGVTATPDEVRRTMHRPWLVLGAILLVTLIPSVLALLAVLLAGGFGP